MDSSNSIADRTDRTISRRQFGAAATAASTGFFAGCGDITTQEFEAEPVTLSEESRSEFDLSEVVSESQTINREIESVDGEVTITNHVAVYDRLLPEGPSMVDRFMGQVGIAPAGWSIDRPDPGQVGFGANPAGGLLDGMGNAGMPDRHGPLRSGVVARGSNMGLGEMTPRSSRANRRSVVTGSI